MKPEQQAKTLLHLRLTTADWLECFSQLTRAELGVLYYIRTRDPYGDRALTIDCLEVGQLLGLHRTSVSRALEQLKHKGLITLEIQQARVSSRINNRRLTLLTQPENASGEENTAYEDSCAPMHTDVRSCTDKDLRQFNLCADAQICALMHSPVQPCTSVCADAQICAPMHNDIYKECACDQTLQTYTNLFQTETAFASVTSPVQFVPSEVERENSKKPLTLVTSNNQAETSQPQDLGEGNFSAAVAEEEILHKIEAAIYNWRSRPWMATATTFKPEMIQAVWRCNSKWYSLEGSNTPNLKKICDRLRQLERQLKRLNADAVTAWEELHNYWRTSQALVNPEMQQQFSQFQVASQQESVQLQLASRKQNTLDAIKDLL